MIKTSKRQKAKKNEKDKQQEQKPVKFSKRTLALTSRLDRSNVYII